MNTFTAEYSQNLAVLHNTTVTGKVVGFAAFGPKGCNLGLLTTYTLGFAGNTLSITLEVNDKINNVWMSVSGATPLVLNTAGSLASTLSVPPGTDAFRLKYTCTGSNTDTIEAVLTGLPQGYTIT